MPLFMTALNFMRDASPARPVTPPVAPPVAPLQPQVGDIARLHRPAQIANAPALLFCGGFHSTMTGNKANHIDALAAGRGLGYYRFDYRGHGASQGDARALGIGHWLNDTLSIIDSVAEPVVLIGSSMGAWLAVLAAERRPERIVGLLTIAAAPDFVSELLLDSLSDDERRAAESKQMAWRSSEYDTKPWPIPPVLISSGHEHRVLNSRSQLALQASMIHGTADTDVPITLSRKLRARRLSIDTPLVEVPGGDHRLSDPASLTVIERELDALLVRIST